MSQINNDSEFKQVLAGLDYAEQRTIAAVFVEHVLDLSNDERLARAIKVAADQPVSADELSAALKSAKSAALDSHTRCGSEGNWSEQAGYFVARAAIAALTPQTQCKAGGPAWQAAMSCRMAKTSTLIDDESNELSSHDESEWQRQTLADHLNA